MEPVVRMVGLDSARFDPCHACSRSAPHEEGVVERLQGSLLGLSKHIRNLAFCISRASQYNERSRSLAQVLGRRTDLISSPWKCRRLGRHSSDAKGAGIDPNGDHGHAQAQSRAPQRARWQKWIGPSQRRGIRCSVAGSAESNA
jgi:hypothetical protein